VFIPGLLLKVKKKKTTIELHQTEMTDKKAFHDTCMLAGRLSHSCLFKEYFSEMEGWQLRKIYYFFREDERILSVFPSEAISRIHLRDLEFVTTMKIPHFHGV
jgi:hypothetical protein